jgi:LCP family protein required for cell wall assembly
VYRSIAEAVTVPGWSMRDRRPRLAGALLVAGVVAPLLLGFSVIVTARNWVALTLDADFLAVVIGIGSIALAARAVALVETWMVDDGSTPRRRLDVVAAGAAVFALFVGAGAVVQVGRARASIAPAFTESGDRALYDPDRLIGTSNRSGQDTATDVTAPSSGTSLPIPGTSVPTRIVPDVRIVATTSTVPPLPRRPDSGVDAAALADVTTVLLLGGDAGPGRSGLRTDTMMLFSLHRPSGRASLVSIPRNAERLLFPPGSALEARYPYGFDDIANAVYPRVSASADLRAAYDVEDVRPGVVALAQALGYSLDVTIDDYVLVDMQGFLDLIDALGGVTLELSSAIPMPGNVPGARTQYPDSIGPGVVEMDGSTALGYVRSRKGDSDYRRTRRQRDLLAALARQISLRDVALSFGGVAAAVGGTLRTSLTPDELATTLNVIGGETAIVESVGLVPPLVDVRRPDYDAMAKVVGAVQLALVSGQPSGY